MPRETEHSDILTRALAVSEVRVVDQANRTIEAYISTGDMDRHGTIIPPSAFRKTIKEYLRNPVLLASHDHWGSGAHAPVIGSIVAISIDEKGVRATIKFAATPLAEEYWTLYRDGHMRGFSIGFRVVKRTRKPREDGTGEFEIYDEIELLEVSCAAIPSNKGALALRTLEDSITRGIATLPREQREFGERVVEWMRAADERSDALHARLAQTERELANALEALRDRGDELDDIRASLDALLTSTGAPAGPANRTAPTAPAPSQSAGAGIF